MIISIKFQNTRVSLCGSIGWPQAHAASGMGRPLVCFLLEMTLRSCVCPAVFLPTTLVVVGFGSQLLVLMHFQWGASQKPVCIFA